MYRQKICLEDKKKIKGGDTALLLRFCEQGNEEVIKELKKREGSVAFQQGISHILDQLISILKDAS
jgi:hypothetical protein